MKLSIVDRLNFDLVQIKNHEWLIGIDEVGWGCIAGDLVIGAIAIHQSLLKDLDRNHSVLSKVRDSKKLSEKIRNSIANFISSENFNGKIMTSLGRTSVEVINQVGLASAYDQALEQIIKDLDHKITLNQSLLLLDGSRVPSFLKTYPINKNIVIKGDDQSFSIGLASIIAKQTRDQLMTDLHQAFPQYKWNENKGYGTAQHVAALKEYGISPHHRTKGTSSILS